jgi:transposase
MVGRQAAEWAGMSKPVFSAREKWLGMIERQRAAGLGVAGFCRENGLATSSFFAWKRKLGRAGAAGGFIEAKVIDAPPASRSAGMIEVRLGNGRRVRVSRGFDRDVLVEVVAVLEGMTPRWEGMS